MPEEAHDSWLGVLGIDVDQIRAKVQGAVKEVETVVDKGIDTVIDGAKHLYNDAENAVSSAVQKVEDAGGAALKRVAQAFTPGASSGPIQSDCKPIHGHVPGPAEHLLCQTHGHILDVNSGQIIAGSLAEYKQLFSSGALGKIATGMAEAGVIGAGIAIAGELASGDDATPLQSKSGAGDGGAGDGGTRDAGASDAGDGSTGEVPTFRTTSPVPVDVRADTADAFVSNSNAAMGNVGEVGHMKPTINWNIETTNGRVTKVNMVVETQIVRPRFAGGRPSDEERAVIKQAEELIKAHEERHRDIARNFTTRAVRAALGRSQQDADNTINRFMRDMDAAQAAMDHREGGIIVEHNGAAGKAGPATGVRSGPAP
jgi:hypothetical protein